MTELDQLKEKTARNGHTQCAARLAAMSQAARQVINPTIVAEVVETSITAENGPTGNQQQKSKEGGETGPKKTSTSNHKDKNKSPKNSPDSGNFHYRSKLLNKNGDGGMIEAASFLILINSK